MDRDLLIAAPVSPTPSPLAAAWPDADTAWIEQQLTAVDDVVRGAISRKLRVSLRAGGTSEASLDAMDLLGDVRLKLLKRLQQPGEARETIAEFRAYAATVAYHACADYLRARYPRRASLKNRLRRLMEKVPAFAVWTTGSGDLLCGFAGWKHTSELVDGKLLADLRIGRQPISRDCLPKNLAGELAPADWVRLLTAVFDIAGAPASLDDLLAVVAPLAGEEDMVEALDVADNDNGQAEGPLDRLCSTELDPQSSLVMREKLKLYWGAILQLLPWHRAAYLLNMRDGDIGVLPYYGIASIQGIGASLELRPAQWETLERCLGVSPARNSGGADGTRLLRCWKHLPLDDNHLATVLGVTRPQVIGYRNKAKERLARMLQPAL